MNTDSPLFLHKSMSSQYMAKIEDYAFKATGAHPAIRQLTSNDAIMAYLHSKEGYTIVNSWDSRLETSAFYALKLEACADMIPAYRENALQTEPAMQFLKGIKDAFCS